MNTPSTEIAAGLEQSLETLRQRAVETLHDVPQQIENWADKVRPDDGTRGRFRWAVETTRAANVGATAYTLGALERMGLKDRVWTEEDRRAGEKWIRGMHVGNQQFRDPALAGRPSPDWPDDEEWPSSSMLEAINQYARKVLGHCVDEVDDLPPQSPPPGWPQADDDPEDIVEWVKTRPYDDNAWGACSHGARMANYMLRWHKEGKLSLRPLVEVVRFFYEIQDEESGLWGTPDQPRHVRINGVHKLLHFLEPLKLPIPHADRIVDRIMKEFQRPDYDAMACGCDEWDNWRVLACARQWAPDHREKEVLKTAAWRIRRSADVFGQPDGGLSFLPEGSTPEWNGFDMAPRRPQGDAQGAGIISAAMSVCVDLLDLQDKTPWTGEWSQGEKESEALSGQIRERVQPS